MLTGISPSIFTDAQSIYMTPVVSAEWNHNLFTPPYMTVAGTGTKITPTLTTGTVTNVTTGAKNPNFTTNSFNTTEGEGSVVYTSSNLVGKAYKIVTYAKTNSTDTILITASAKGVGDSTTDASNQYGTTHEEIDSLGWTKIITYIGVSDISKSISSFTYSLSSNSLNDITDNPIVYFTVPEIYETTYFDYRNSSLYPTESVFEYFRPGESYVTSGDNRCTLPSDYRKITSSVIPGYTSNTYSPISPIIQNPEFFLASPPVPVFKTSLPSNINQYKYFVSDNTATSITGIYQSAVRTNKLVIKFNTLMTVPNVNVYINGSIITVSSNTSITPDSRGLLTLYWNGSAWTTNKWGTQTNPTLPQFNDSGALSVSTTVSKITVTQIGQTPNTEFTSYSSSSVTKDLSRMQVIEISPRLEIDLTSLVQSVTIDKSLDSNNSVLPISSLNTNDASINFTGIPGISGNDVVPIFSMQSTQGTTILANILRKNVKIYLGYILSNYTYLGGSPTDSGSYIPGGVFYSDDWQENDMQTVSVQAYDVSRFLQTFQVSDYVANLKTVFEVITNILDLSGFTDYDYDSLFKICNNKSYPMDFSYYYCNSQDTTILDALNDIFMAYQIGAYIDEYGIMQFLSLQDILSNQTSDISISDYSILQGGYSSSVSAKPGKVSLRYQTPKIKQSPSLHNFQDTQVKNSPSYALTTSNDVVWSQQTMDSVGFNYLNADMSEFANEYKLNVNDLLDIFHTFNVSHNGYVFIENEIVSFEYKEFDIYNEGDEANKETVRVKNNLELNAEISKFIKKYDSKLRVSFATITNAVGNGTTVTYTANNNFRVGDKVMVTAMNPQKYSLAGEISERSSTWFKILDSTTGTYVSGGQATIFADYDIIVRATGNIVGVQRGLFGTGTKPHTRIGTTLASKGLSQGSISSAFVASTTTGRATVINSNDPLTGGNDSLPDVKKIRVTGSGTTKTIIYPTTERDNGYQTYSVKFDMPSNNLCSAGLFFNMTSTTNSTGAYFVELTRTSEINTKTNTFYSPARYKYLLTVYDYQGTMYAWSDVTGECNSIVNNFSKIVKKNTSVSPATYTTVSDNAFNLKVVRNYTDGTDGENATTQSPKQMISVFINNVEISGWSLPGTPYNATTNPEESGWSSAKINNLTGMAQKPVVPNNMATGRVFGFFASIAPLEIDTYPEIVYATNPSIYPASLREIHATKKALNERSVSYFYQDRQFLNGMIQNQPLYSISPTYIMQTTPEVSGINFYDVQYMTPAAVSVDILPIMYKMDYYPSENPQDRKQKQTKFVYDDSLSYSTPINTGFRCVFAIANNSPHVVFLSKDSTGTERVTANLNLWTHEIIAPSDPSIIEAVIDPGNPSEAVQIDSEWIQSLDSAKKLMRLIEKSIDGFSRTVNINIFGNPLIQIGDVVDLSYSLKGISGQKYVVHSVSNIFESGLQTSLTLKKI
jgi:hypothetical protein